MLKLIARVFLRLAGWTHDPAPPAHDKYVLVAAPHTSNWDYIFMVAVAKSLDMPLRWMGKHTLFGTPIGPILRKTGGVPVDRRAPQGLVHQMVETIEASEEMVLAIPAEGSRSIRDHWKSGFLHIAKEAGIPVVFGYIDYAQKHAGFGPHVHPKGDYKDAMDVAREFYKDKRGKFHEKFSPIRLRSELPAPEQDD